MTNVELDWQMSLLLGPLKLLFLEVMLELIMLQ